MKKVLTAVLCYLLVLVSTVTSFAATKDISSLKTQSTDSGINLKAKQKKNKDIAAWIEIEGLDLSEAVMCRDGDNEYYLNRNNNGKKSSNGSLYIEDYNSTDFTDRVTVIYGHNMRSGAMFGNLQECFSNKKKFEKYPTFTIHTTEGEFEYKVFAAVPFNNKHLLYYNNFSKFSGLQKFLKKVYAVDDSKAHFNTDIEIGENDRIVILATCMDGNGSKRYLVMGVYQESEKSAESAEQ